MVPLGVFVLSHDTKIVFWNRCFEDWTGITAQTAVGTPLAEVPYARTAIHEAVAGYLADP